MLRLLIGEGSMAFTHDQSFKGLPMRSCKALRIRLSNCLVPAITNESWCGTHKGVERQPI